MSSAGYFMGDGLAVLFRSVDAVGASAAPNAVGASDAVGASAAPKPHAVADSAGAPQAAPTAPPAAPAAPLPPYSS